MAQATQISAGGVCFVAGAVLSWAANADVVISSNATENMTCSAGTCEPTATDAVLNVSDLENMLAAGNATVTTTGSGVQANNIDVEKPLTWSAQSLLALNADSKIAVDQEILVPADGGLSLTKRGDVDLFPFGKKGRIVFQSVSSPFTIDGTAYVLVSNIASLASAIAANPSGSYALAGNYDASQDGTYAAAPIQTVFTGTFDGLGNTISHLSINHTGSVTGLGLFLFVSQPGTVEHLRLAQVDIGGTGAGQGDEIGALAGISTEAYFYQDFATGRIRLKRKLGFAGGLVGQSSDDNIDTCYANVTIDATKATKAWAGGLAGQSYSTITDSFASGAVTGGNSDRLGGLVGSSLGIMKNSYSTGAVSGGVHSQVGGLVGRNPNPGENEPTVYSSYSIGAVSCANPSEVGGFAGTNGVAQSDVYWDTTTSGTTQGVGKGTSQGITGLTMQQLQSGLPKGFDHKIWGEKQTINNGLPYLLANPPSE